uniref:Uncharacterized protein B14D6.270 n=1 Tax=Neurospora crassa TaxID=5141 RepID=Q8X0A1_NEUCS|nr:conserved hypothetical protein [Neurospora crassa]
MLSFRWLLKLEIPGDEQWQGGGRCRQVEMVAWFKLKVVFIHFRHYRKQTKKHGAMAPTETKILSDYLLVPAQLPAIISLQEFIELFPRSLQSSPQIRNLYRDLQTQRNAVVDSVAAEIEAEAKRGKAMRRVMIKAKREEEAPENDDEAEIERLVRYENRLRIAYLQ